MDEALIEHVIEFELTADTARFETAMRRAGVAVGNFARLLNRPEFQKALRRLEVRQRRRRQQIRYRDQRAARRARRAARDS